jgi:hypothetical protein
MKDGVSYAGSVDGLMRKLDEAKRKRRASVPAAADDHRAKMRRLEDGGKATAPRRCFVARRLSSFRCTCTSSFLIL